MTDPDIPERPKKEWPDGKERICTGSVVEYKDGGRMYSRPLVTHETPREVREIMRSSSPDEMIELHHHADPASPIYIRNESITSIDVRWDIVEPED